MTAEPDEPSELDLLLQDLRGNPRERVLALQSVSRLPISDAQLLTLCESLLEDRAMALISIPYSFAEVRWCAADAVAALRGVLGIEEPVMIPDVFAPTTGGKEMTMLRAAGIRTQGGVEGIIEGLEEAARLGLLPRRRIKREPFVPAAREDEPAPRQDEPAPRQDEPGAREDEPAE